MRKMSGPKNWMILMAGLALAASGCDCGGPSGGDGGLDAGADGGLDAGSDAGPADGGVDGGMDGGADGGADGGPEIRFEIDQVIPVRGAAAGGTRVTLNGRGFVSPFARIGEDVETETAVLFGGNTAIEFTVIDDDTIEVVTPPGLPGARDVVVQNPNGEAVCGGCFTYFTPVTVTDVSPSASPLEGGVEVTLQGAGFVEGTVVLVGERGAIDVQVLDDATITFFAPPAALPGVVDVTVFNKNGLSSLRRRFTYFERPRLIRLDPPVGPAAGGVTVRLEGEGLPGATSVLFGSTPATGLSTSGTSSLLVTLPPGVAGSTVDVTVNHPNGDTDLPAAFAYVDPSVRDVSLLLVSPPRGPVSGGLEVILAGTGLDHPGTQVRFGDRDGTAVSVLDAHRLRVTVPAAVSPGLVDVQVRNERGGASLPAGFRYFEPIVVDSVSPTSGPAVGGTAVTVTGAGFTAAAEVRVGALPATSVVVVDSATITAVTAPGSPGAADVVVSEGVGPDRNVGRLDSGFVYEDALTLGQISPARGSRAGGTLVTLTGTGFTDDVSVRFGGRDAVVQQRLGQNLLTVRSPPGSPGLTDVRVEASTENDVLPKAFQYYDPTNLRGGASGGPMAGTINVTVLDGYSGLPIPDALVQLGADPATPFQGMTDVNGQITFSDPSLVKAVDVTAVAAGYQAVTVSRVDARDLTMFLLPNEGDPSPPPEFPPPAFVGGTGTDGSLGRVCGFKLPPNRVLGPNQVEEARVFITARSLFNLPPFDRAPGFQVVTEDCGTFSMPSRAGNVAVYAYYGIKTTDVDPASGQTVETFEPLLMGITRGIEVPAIVPPVCTANRACPGGFACSKSAFDPEDPGDFGFCLCEVDAACGTGEICNIAGGCQPPLEADIVLSMHMDLDVPIRLVNAPVAPAGELHLAFSYLELGGEGAIYVGLVQSTTDRFDFPDHPRLPGDGFVFLDLATNGGGYPLSLYFRRQVGDLAAGVDIGPMQPFTRLLSPVPGGALNGNRIQWAYDGTPEPDVVQIDIDEPGFVPKPLWSIVLPGSETTVEVPENVLEILRESPALSITVTTALSPRFDFDHFSYNQLSPLSWNSFTLDSQFFVVP